MCSFDVGQHNLFIWLPLRDFVPVEQAQRNDIFQQSPGRTDRLKDRQ